MILALFREMNAVWKRRRFLTWVAPRAGEEKAGTWSLDGSRDSFRFLHYRFSDIFVNLLNETGVWLSDNYMFLRMMKTLDTSIERRRCRSAPRTQFAMVFAGRTHITSLEGWFRQLAGFEKVLEERAPNETAQRCVPFAAIGRWITGYCSLSGHCTTP